MEFRKKDAEDLIQQFLPLCPAAYIQENGQLGYGYTVWILGECEGHQTYIDDKAARGINKKILVGDINTEIKKLEVQTKWYEDQYNKYYPPQGHTTEEVIHLDLATGERTQEERSRIESPVERDYIRFKNAVKIEFLKLIKRDINRHIIRARIPSKEERLALEARAARIIQEAQEKAEADFQKLVSVELPRQLAKYAKAEHGEFIRDKLQELRQWLKKSYKPWLDFEGFSAEELIVHMMGSDVIRTQAEALLLNNLAERIKVVRYVEHLAALADEREPAKKPGRKSKEFSLGPELLKLIEPIKKALQAKGLLGEQGQFIIGKSTHIKALYNVLIYKGKIPKKGYDEKFASFFRESFGFSISGRTLRNPPNIGQEEEEQDFKALF